MCGKPAKYANHFILDWREGHEFLQAALFGESRDGRN